MKRLFCDDSRNAPDELWMVARTVTSAIRAIARFDWDEISLDHDISHQVTVGALGRPYPCEETFEAVAHYIAAKHWHDIAIDGSNGQVRIGRLNKIPKITLHTSNPVGAKNMKAILKDVGIPCEIKMTGAANRLELEV